MARTGWSTSNYLSVGAAVSTTLPLTFAAWVNRGSAGISGNPTILSMGWSGGTGNYIALQIDGSSGGGIRANVNDGASSFAVTSATLGTSTWAHAAAVFSSSTSRAAYLNGGNKGTSTASKTWANTPDRTGIGIIPNSPAQQAFASAGAIAEAAIWSVALTDAEIATLATGVSPLAVRPGSLLAYWPLIGQTSPEPNFINAASAMSITGSLSAAAHPRIIMPPRQSIIV